MRQDLFQVGFGVEAMAFAVLDDGVEHGVGKSSILEALDTFFNGREWVLTKDSKREEAILSPLFLIKKSDIESSYLPQFFP